MPARKGAKQLPQYLHNTTPEPTSCKHLSLHPKRFPVIFHPHNTKQGESQRVTLASQLKRGSRGKGPVHCLSGGLHTLAPHHAGKQWSWLAPELVRAPMSDLPGSRSHAGDGGDLAAYASCWGNLFACRKGGQSDRASLSPFASWLPGQSSVSIHAGTCFNHQLTNANTASKRHIGIRLAARAFATRHGCKCFMWRIACAIMLSIAI